jgi:hypothetical protein
MIVNLVRLFCEPNPDLVQPLITGNKSRQGIPGKHLINNQAIDNETWKLIKGVIDKTGKVSPRTGIPINDKSNGGEKHEKSENRYTEARKIPVV